jgi:hypothetical protein
MNLVIAFVLTVLFLGLVLWPAEGIVYLPKQKVHYSLGLVAQVIYLAGLMWALKETFSGGNTAGVIMTFGIFISLGIIMMLSLIKKTYGHFRAVC